MVININYEEEVLSIMKTLDDITKKKVLNFVKTVSKHPKTVSGKEFVENTKHIRISDEDAAEMMQVISEAFDTVDNIEVNFDE